jgi:hypothetical protein
MFTTCVEVEDRGFGIIRVRRPSPNGSLDSALGIFIQGFAALQL